MQINPKSIKKQFEKSMDKYNENAVVQKIMAEKLVEHIPEKNFNTILELGSGTGLLTELINRNFNYNHYIANDIVPRSKKYLDKILTNYEFILGNAQKIKLNKPCDLIVSNAMFQWFKSPELIFNNCLENLNNKGYIAFSTFSPKNYIEIKEITGLSLEYKTIDELKKILQNNYEIIHTEEFEYQLKFDTPLQLLAHMKNTGVNSINTKNWTIKEIKDFCNDYQKKHPDIKLTYAPIIFIAQKSNK